jgi:hypothetical protein
MIKFKFTKIVAGKIITLVKVKRILGLHNLLVSIDTVATGIGLDNDVEIIGIGPIPPVPTFNKALPGSGELL